MRPAAESSRLSLHRPSSPAMPLPYFFPPRSKFFFKISIIITSSFIPLCVRERNVFPYLPGRWRRVSPAGRWRAHPPRAHARCPLPACGWWDFENKTEVIGGEGVRAGELGTRCRGEQSRLVCFLSFHAHTAHVIPWLQTAALFTRCQDVC